MSDTMNLFYISQDGTYQKLADIKEVSISNKDEEVPKISFNSDEELSFTINLERQSKKVFGRIFQMQKYKVTEWMFPKKKKRGTARRIRRRKGEANERL